METLPIEDLTLSQTTALRVGPFCLRPFCLAHLIRFEEIDDADPFFQDPDDWPRNVFYSILICQNSFEQLLDLEIDPNLYRKHARKVNRFLRGRTEIIPLAQDIGQWIHDAVKFPSSTKTEQGQKCDQSNSPWYQIMSITLRKELGIPEAEVMNRPLQSNIVDWYSLMDRDNVINFDSREDFETAKSAREFAETSTFDEMLERLNGN
jgi:hypothetical protein